MIEQKILDIMRFVFQNDSIDRTCSQQNCETWDSLNQINLVVELEMAFGISLEPEEIAQMCNYDEVKRIVKYKTT